MNKKIYIYFGPRLNKALVVLFSICSFGMIIIAYFLFKSHFAATNFINSDSRNLSLMPPLFSLFFSLLLIYPVINYFLNRNRLFIDIERLSITFDGRTYNFKWEEISQIGFQVLISEKSFGVREAIPYLALKLKDISKINFMKDHEEFGFIQKKDDLKKLKHQEDILDLYVSLRFAKYTDSFFLDFLKNKSAFAEHLKPLVRTDSEDEYDSVLKEKHASDL
ncbi:MAG: hypothetical protein COZ34_04730 [Candidatus Pacebacteria bacterium CG_4_10_14_3_um_filter_34_15]|nr:MAG: hypothetical protein AUJ41_00100 [Candidatus Pacebacteria bacterium CG1_02_43_31]PIX81154.1 MAG: hypothetical protein COZ34_04730 [Candidatus Pacebacteria bacterium CG_4_10_14_3_um_filter_34_15]PJC44001.1 MAG: hypothetical protein CO039_01205 [Candidatus Pacebacteria bacterium CG_4_9_14_0_2_um_filter_34_50]